MSLAAGTPGWLIRKGSHEKDLERSLYRGMAGLEDSVWENVGRFKYHPVESSQLSLRLRELQRSRCSESAAKIFTINVAKRLGFYRQQSHVHGNM